MVCFHMAHLIKFGLNKGSANVTEKEKLNIVLGNLNARANHNKEVLDVFDSAVVELAEIISTQDEAIMELARIIGGDSE